MSMSIMERIHDALANIAGAVKSVLASTRTILGKILKNPVTWILIVGGLFFIFRKWIFKWLKGKQDTLMKGIIFKIKWLATNALGFLKTCWNVLVVVGKFLFNAIDYLTKPSGPIAKFIVSVIKTFVAVKKWIKKMIKMSGQNSVDALCMFLAGDYIGMAISIVGAYVSKAWDYLKNTKLIRFVRNLIGSLVAFGKFVFNAGTVVMRSLSAGFWQLIKGNFGGVVGAAVKPWKILWG